MPSAGTVCSCFLMRRVAISRWLQWRGVSSRSIWSRAGGTSGEQSASRSLTTDRGGMAHLRKLPSQLRMNNTGHRLRRDRWCAIPKNTVSLARNKNRTREASHPSQFDCRKSKRFNSVPVRRIKVRPEFYIGWFHSYSMVPMVLADVRPAKKDSFETVTSCVKSKSGTRGPERWLHRLTRSNSDTSSVKFKPSWPSEISPSWRKRSWRSCEIDDRLFDIPTIAFFAEIPCPQNLPNFALVD